MDPQYVPSPGELIPNLRYQSGFQPRFSAGVLYMIDKKSAYALGHFHGDGGGQLIPATGQEEIHEKKSTENPKK
jgi:hypothetical protein